jgi:hypothetical protein
VNSVESEDGWPAGYRIHATEFVGRKDEGQFVSARGEIDECALPEGRLNTLLKKARSSLERMPMKSGGFLFDVTSSLRICGSRMNRAEIAW